MRHTRSTKTSSRLTLKAPTKKSGAKLWTHTYKGAIDPTAPPINIPHPDCCE